MLEERVEPDVGYRAPYNPEFLRRAREKKQREETAQRKIEARRRAEEIEAKRRVERAEERLAHLVGALVASGTRDQKASYIRINGKTPVREIIATVAAEHGIRVSDIVGPCRIKHIVEARFAAVAEARRLRPDLSLPQLGREFGRDHTTILATLRKMGQRTDEAA